MKLISLFVLLFSINVFAEEAQETQEEKQIEAMLVELAENGYDDKEVINSLDKVPSRLPASVRNKLILNT